MKNIFLFFFFFFFFFYIIFTLSAFSQGNGKKVSLLEYTDSTGKTKIVKSTSDWAIRRNLILENIQKVMGLLPDASKRVPPDVHIEEEVIIENIRRIKVDFTVEKNDRVTAYLLIPANIKGRVPGILCLHQTTEIGKGEPAGVGGNPDLHYALELAKRGYVTLAPDYPNFGDYHVDPYTIGYSSTSMKGIWNHMAAVDLLQSLPEVDPKRIGCIGHSLGGHNSLFLAVFDKRIKVVVTSCGFNSFFKYYNGDLTGWSHKGYMPRIAELYGKDPSKMPFDFTDILGALAPRPIFINAPLNDSNFEVSGVFDCVNAAKPVYNLFKASDKIVMVNPDAPHAFPHDVREAAYLFLDKELKYNFKNR